MNQIRISGVLIEKSPVRYTPGGIAIVDGAIHHTAEVYEAGGLRRLEFDSDVIACGEAGLKLAEVTVGTPIEINGFLAPRSFKSRKLTVHITNFIH